MATEKEIESSILDYMNLQNGCFAFKINTAGIWDPSKKVYRTNKNRHIHNGTSDILGVYQGRFFAIEVKRPKTDTNQKTQASKNQKAFLEKVSACGGCGYVARSVDDAREILLDLEHVGLC